MLPFFHRLVSRHILKSAGFAPSVAAVVAETARWPDWYRWTDAAANASTPTDAAGLPLDPDAAADASAALLRGYLQRLVDSQPAEQLVWLGFALHLVQDLAAHQGRTNPEHAFQALLIFPNPDYAPAGIIRGLHFSRQLLDAVSEQLGRRQYDELCKRVPARLLTPAEAEALLGRRNFSIRALASVVSTARHYVRLPKAARCVRWDVEHVLADGLRR